MHKGDKISEYILLNRLGEGGFGEVWKAKHEILPDKIVAVKIPTDEHYIEQLRSEGLLQHALEHPNIVRTLGLSVTSSPPYFIMDLVEGKSLGKKLKTSGRIPFLEALNIFTQISEALAYAHDKGVVHADIKPENILIRHDGKAMLTDFGLGRVAQSCSASLALEGSLITKEGQSIAGTLDYMSPEQKQGEDFGPESDIYALGIVLFEMLTGELPQPQDLPSQLVGGLPHYIDQLFSKCYTRIDKRYKNGSELLSGLEKLKRHFPKTNVQTAGPEKQRAVEEPLSGCLVLMTMLVGSLAGFALGFILTHSPVFALAGAGIGLVLGARLLRPKYLIIALGGAILGGIISRSVVGALIGVIGAEVIATFLEMGKNG